MMLADNEIFATLKLQVLKFYLHFQVDSNYVSKYSCQGAESFSDYRTSTRLQDSQSSSYKRRFANTTSS